MELLVISLAYGVAYEVTVDETLTARLDHGR